VAAAAAVSALTLAAAPPASAATTITVTCTGPVTFYEHVGASYQLEFGPECKKTGSTDDGVINSRSQGLDADEAGFFSIPEEPDSGRNLWYAYAYDYEEWNGKTVTLRYPSREDGVARPPADVSPAVEQGAVGDT
jgi:hypothetical protein